MSCPCCINTSCPEPSVITLNASTLSIEVVRETFAAETGSSVVLAAAVASGYDPEVFRGGVLQRVTTHYTISSDDPAVVTFTTPLVAEDVVVRYVQDA